MVFTLEEMVVVLKITGSGWALIAMAKAPGMNKGANQELFPTKLMEKRPSAGILGIDRRVRLPVNRIKGCFSPIEMMAVG